MALTKLGLKRYEKSKGNTPSGTKVYLVGSDTPISDEDLDDVLDATVGASSIPEHNDLWKPTESINLRVESKRAMPYDVEEGTLEGYWWTVTVNYAVSSLNEDQDAEDPRDRAWLWSKSTEKTERVIINSLFDTTDYVYPEAEPEQMDNLPAGFAITNTAGEPPEGGVTGPVSNGVFSFTKYVNAATDLGVGSWAELDDLVDKLNDDTFQMLGRVYEKWELYMEDISYMPVSENGYDVMKVDFKVVADTFKTHVFSFPSAGYNERVPISGSYETRRIQDEDGEDAVNPRLLDIDGSALPLPSSPPFILEPILISAGRHELADWSGLTLPATI